jgi:FkbM family methyltransferase
MYCAGGDDGVAMKYYWNGSYESNTLRIWSILARQSPSKIIIDVGAHTGIYSLAAISQGAKLTISIEPHFANFSRLTLNLRANSYPTRNAMMLAAGDSKGWATFVLPTNIDYLSTGGKISDNATGLKFPVMTMPLDGLVDITRHGEVSMLKIDVEGLEHLVLRGAREIIANSKPYIFIECVDREASSGAEDILNAYGYEYYLIEDDRGVIRRVEKLIPECQEDGKINMFRLNRIAVPKGIGLAPLLMD